MVHCGSPVAVAPSCGPSVALPPMAGAASLPPLGLDGTVARRPGGGVGGGQVSGHSGCVVKACDWTVGVNNAISKSSEIREGTEINGLQCVSAVALLY